MTTVDPDVHLAGLLRERGRAAVELAVMRARHKDADNMLLSYGRRWSNGYRGEPDDYECKIAERAVYEVQVAAQLAKQAAHTYANADKAFREAERADRPA